MNIMHKHIMTKYIIEWQQVSATYGFASECRAVCVHVCVHVCVKEEEVCVKVPLLYLN